MKAENIHVGDFVRCRSKYYRDQLEISEDPGLVIEIKRSNSKVLYPGDKRCWLPREMITRVPPEPGYAPFLQKLNFLLKRVHAHECEIVTAEISTGSRSKSMESMRPLWTISDLSSEIVTDRYR